MFNSGWSRSRDDHEWVPAPAFFSRDSNASGTSGRAILPPPADPVSTDAFRPPSRTAHQRDHENDHQKAEGRPSGIMDDIKKEGVVRGLGHWIKDHLPAYDESSTQDEWNLESGHPRGPAHEKSSLPPLPALSSASRQASPENPDSFPTARAPGGKHPSPPVSGPSQSRDREWIVRNGGRSSPMPSRQPSPRTNAEDLYKMRMSAEDRLGLRTDFHHVSPNGSRNKGAESRRLPPQQPTNPSQPGNPRDVDQPFSMFGYNLWNSGDHNSGDSAAGIHHRPADLKPTALGRSEDPPLADDAAGHGAGVGSMFHEWAEGVAAGVGKVFGVSAKDAPGNDTAMAKAFTPGADCHLLGSSSSYCEGPVVVHDGYGHKVLVEHGREKAFPVQLDTTGAITWEHGHTKEALRVGWSQTNWIVARYSADFRNITWTCYQRHPWMPNTGLVYVGREVVPLLGDGSITTQDASGDEVLIQRGQDRVLIARLDEQGNVYWHCGPHVQKIPAPSDSVAWIHVEYPHEGHDVIWTFYEFDEKLRAGSSNKSLGNAHMSMAGSVKSRGSMKSKASSESKASSKKSLPIRSRDQGLVGSEVSEVEIPEKRSVSRSCCHCEEFPLCSVYCPGTFACLVILCILATIGALWPGMDIDTDFESFLEADSRANSIRAAFVDALDSRGAKRRLSGGRPRNLIVAGVPSRGYEDLDPSVLHKIFKVEILYRTKDGSNMLELGKLKAVAGIEQDLRERSGWNHVCRTLGNPTLRPLCDPGGSFTNFVWPSMETRVDNYQKKFFTFNITGTGNEPVPLEVAIAFARHSNMLDLFLPKGYSGEASSSELRSLFEFDLKVCRVEDPMSFRKEKLATLKVEYDKFVEETLYPALLKQAEEERDFDVFWKGGVLDSVEVWDTLKTDCALAIGSFVFILVYLTAHTQSPVLGFSTLIFVLISIPTAFVTSARMSGGNRITGASFLSLFLLVGLGADVVLVFVSFWEISRELYEENEYPERIKFMYSSAGLACLATSCTTAGSFFANLASVLKPLREFGFFMGLCIMGAYSFILVGLPPVLIFSERVTTCCKGIFLGRETQEHQELSQTPNLSAGGTIRRGTAEESYFQKCLDLYTDQILVPFKKVTLFLCILLPVVFLMWTGLAAKVDGDMPQMFPEDHNQNAGKRLSKRFESIDEMWVNTYAQVCNFGRDTPCRGNNRCEGCAMTWCQIGVGSPMIWQGFADSNGHSECFCKPTVEPPDTDRCKKVNRNHRNEVVEDLSVPSNIRFIGPQWIPNEFWLSKAWKDFLIEATEAENKMKLGQMDVQAIPTTSENISRMVQEHWETGNAYLTNYMIAATSAIVIPKEVFEHKWEVREVCGPSQVCYCGTPTCKFRDERIQSPADESIVWRRLEISLNQDFRRLDYVTAASGIPSLLGENLAHPMSGYFTNRHAPGRRLLDFVDVSLVWGISVQSGSKLLGTVEPSDLWSFSDDFRPEQPAAQRQLFKACKFNEEHPQLLIFGTVCWMQEFRDYVRMRGEVFPARSSRFTSLLRQYRSTGLLASGNTISDYMWFDDFTNKLKATYVVYKIDMSNSATPASKALEYQAMWDQAVGEYEQGFNAFATGGTWHTSRLWIRAEAEKAIIDSTMTTLAVSISCGFVGAITFTHLNIIVSFFVVLSVVGVTCCLAFFMTIVMGWAIGAIEVLGLIVFVGYSITYSLHIAHKYCEHMKRTAGKLLPSVRRTLAVKHSLDQMTRAVLGSAFTTLGAAFFLFFCKMQIFTKLAAVLFAVTVFAEIFALVALPAGLLVAGPRGAFGCYSLCGTEGDPDDRGLLASTLHMAADILAKGTGAEGEEPRNKSRLPSRADTEYSYRPRLDTGDSTLTDEITTPKSNMSKATAKTNKSEVFISNAPKYNGTPVASPTLPSATAVQLGPRGGFGELSQPMPNPAPDSGANRPRVHSGSSASSTSANPHGFASLGGGGGVNYVQTAAQGTPARNARMTLRMQTAPPNYASNSNGRNAESASPLHSRAE